EVGSENFGELLVKMVNVSSLTGLFPERLCTELGSLIPERFCEYPNTRGEVPANVWIEISSGYVFGRLAIRQCIGGILVRETGHRNRTQQSINGYVRGCLDIIIRSGGLWKACANSLEARMELLLWARDDGIRVRTGQTATSVSGGDLLD